MNQKYENLEQNLSLSFKRRSLSESRQDLIWKTVENKIDRSRLKRKRVRKFAIGVLALLALVVIALGPGEVLAQVRSWLIPNYRPVGQPENLVLVPVESGSNYERLNLNLLTVVSTEKELYISVGVSGFDPSELAMDNERFFEQPYLLLPGGKVFKSNGASYGYGDGSTDFILDIHFPALEQDPGEEISLVVPDLPFKSNPLDEAWEVTMTVAIITNDDKLPSVDQNMLSEFEPSELKAEIVDIKNIPARGTTIKVKVNIPETFEFLNFLIFWSLRDDQGGWYPIEDVYHCANDPRNKDCPTDEVEFTIHPVLPVGRTYTLQIDQIILQSIVDLNFYEVSGETKVDTFLTIDFPDAYSKGDYIEVDRWFNFEPYSFHLLGVEVLQANEDQVKFRLVMQSPDPVTAISICINRFVKGAGCQGPSRNGMIPPDPDDLIYNTVSFPEYLTGPVEFFLNQVTLEYWVDWELEFEM